MMKKSSPGSPCLTTVAPDSNDTFSRESDTVSRSHLSNDSEMEINLVTGIIIHLSKDLIKDRFYDLNSSQKKLNIFRIYLRKQVKYS